MRHRFWNRLSARLLLVALGPALLVSAALSTPMIELRRQQLLQQADERVVQAGRMTEAIFAERLGFAELLAELLAERAAFVQMERADDPAALAEFVRATREHTLFDLVTVVDESGSVLAQDGAGQLWHGLRPEPLSVSGAPGLGVVVEVHAPVPTSAGPARTFVGSFALDERTLGTFRERTGMEQSLLVDGRLVAASLPGRAAALGDAPSSEHLTAGMLDEPRTEELRVDGALYLARYKPLRDPAGQVVAVAELLLPLESVRAAQRQASILLLVITLLAVLAATLFALILARWVARPVRALSLASAALGRGELERPVRAGGPVELVTLGEVLETTRGRLAAARTALADEKARYAAILESISIVDPEICTVSEVRVR